MSIASSALLVAAHPPHGLGWLAPVALVPLLIAIRGQGLASRCWLGWLAGTVWASVFVGTWLFSAVYEAVGGGRATAAAVAFGATQIYGAVQVAVFAALAGRCRLERSREAVWLAAVWVSSEVLRSEVVGGIPWGLLGQSQWRSPELIQLASICGVMGVSFWLVVVNAALAAAWVQRRRRSRSLLHAAVAASVLLGVFGFGVLRLGSAPAAASHSIRVVHTDWPELGSDRASELLGRQVELTRKTSASAETELTLWPEAALRRPPSLAPELAHSVFELVRESGVDVLFGAPRVGKGEFFNSVFRVSAGGDRLYDLRDKRRLVPLAEAPWPGLPSPGAFAAGSDSSALPAGDLRIAVLVCFEALFADLALVEVADFYFNPTNDVRVGAGAEQQAAMAVFRAVENGRSLLRVANAGPSLLVDPRGRIRARADGWGAEVWQVPEPLPGTAYRSTALALKRAGFARLAGVGWFAWGCFIATLAGVVVTRRQP